MRLRKQETLMVRASESICFYFSGRRIYVYLHNIRRQRTARWRGYRKLLVT